jgi:hypothetical protein
MKTKKGAKKYLGRNDFVEGDFHVSQMGEMEIRSACQTLRLNENSISAIFRLT